LPHSSFDRKSEIMETTLHELQIKPLERRFEMGWFKSGEIGATVESDGEFRVTGKLRF
jgi:hypothetical protein